MPPSSHTQHTMSSIDLSTCDALSTQAVVDEMAAASRGSKAEYFRLLQHRTSPHNLSGVRRMVPAARQLLDTTIRLAFIGDSIMRELSFAWHAIAPDPTPFTATGLEKSGSATYANRFVYFAPKSQEEMQTDGWPEVAA